MLKILLIIMILSLKSPVALGTTFIPITIEKQLQTVSAVVLGNFLKESSVKLASGEIATKAHFQVLKSSGLDLINKNEVEVFYPGGMWQGVVYHVYGAPKFKLGEKNVLLLIKKDNRYWIQDLGLGKYHYKEEERKVYLSSSVFPAHSSLGKIPFEKFSLIVEDILGQKLAKARSDKFVVIASQRPRIKSPLVYQKMNDEKHKANPDQINQRGIASVNNDLQKDGDELSEGASGLSWPMAIFIIVGLFFTWYRKKIT